MLLWGGSLVLTIFAEIFGGDNPCLHNLCSIYGTLGGIFGGNHPYLHLTASDSYRHGQRPIYIMHLYIMHYAFIHDAFMHQ